MSTISDFADDYFTSISLVYDDVEENICKFLPSVLFSSDKNIEHRQIAIPDNTLDNFFMYRFGRNEHVANLYNIRIGRLYETEDFTVGTPTETYTLVTDYESQGETLIAAMHGDGLVFDTEDAGRNIILECSVVYKDSDYIDREIADAIKYLYYYLYTENTDSFYNYLKRLSLLKKNRMNENVKTKRSRKIYYSTFIPLEL